LLKKGKAVLPTQEIHMPRSTLPALPTVNAVLQMAYAEARRMADRPPAESDSPVMLEAVSTVWSLVKDRLPAGDDRVRKLDELITQITIGHRPSGK
jgi:hypothetical protein